MKRGLAIAGMILAWMMIISAGLVLIFELPELYLLLTGQIEPGQALPAGDTAVTVKESATAVAVYSAVVAAGFALKWFAGRYEAAKAP